MSIKWQEAKDPLDQDFYEITISKEWLGKQVVDSVTFDVPSASGLVFGAVTISANLASSFVTGGVVGEWDIDVTITSGDRVIQRLVTLTVADR